MKFQKGFAPLIILILVVITTIGVFTVYKSDSFKKSESQTVSGQTPSPSLLASPSSKFLLEKATTTPPTKTNTASPKPTKSPTPVPTPRQISVSGFTYEDRNDNGIMDSDDPKLKDMQLYFYDSISPTTIRNTIFTDINGNFTTSLSILGNMILTPSTYGNFRPRTSSSLTFSTNTSNIKIGFRSASAPAPNLTGIIEGDIYQDTNRNNARDAGESSTRFYKLYLTDSSGNYYNTVENAQTTDDGGHFKWINLPADRTFTIRLSGMDVVLDKSEYPYTLSGTHTEERNIQIPIYKTSNW